MSAKIFLDPGHGGHDGGAFGPTGLREADVVLAVCLRLRAALMAGGFEVKMSRETDTYPSLSDRCHMSNDWGSDLFLSVHCNSADNDASGIETFHAVGSKNGVRAAARVQEEMMYSFSGHKDRGVKARNFKVLRSTKAPAVLAELEFIQTISGEKHLRNEHVQAVCSDALHRGVLRYFDLIGPSNTMEKKEPVAAVLVTDKSVADEIADLSAKIIQLTKNL